jgi:hypothetical protein
MRLGTAATSRQQQEQQLWLLTVRVDAQGLPRT